MIIDQQKIDEAVNTIIGYGGHGISTASSAGPVPRSALGCGPAFRSCAAI